MNHSASLIHREVVTSQLLQNIYLPPFHEFQSSAFETRTFGKDRIAFGSCNDQSRLNPFWPILEERKPAAFIWGGDAIYSVSLSKPQNIYSKSVTMVFSETLVTLLVYVLV